MYKILFEDDEMIAAEKPVGLATIPERFEKACLVSSLSEILSIKLFVVHRLDKEVSGVVLFAKNAQMHRLLNDLFSKHVVKKRYAAIIHGQTPENEGAIEYPIRQFGSGRMGVDLQRGKPCSTFYKVVFSNITYSSLYVFPKTGRRHQIRVHLYATGNPIVGDSLYGERSVQDQYPRLFLHGASLSVPLQKGELNIESSVPEEFKGFFG